MSDDPPFAKGDLNGVMAAHQHVADWVRDFEARYGSRPIYYGELDRDAKKRTSPLTSFTLPKNLFSFTFTNLLPMKRVGAKFCGLVLSLNSQKRKKTFVEN